MAVAMTMTTDVAFHVRHVQIMELLATVQQRQFAVPPLPEAAPVAHYAEPLGQRRTEPDLVPTSVLFRDDDARRLIAVLDKKLHTHDLVQGIGARLRNVFRSAGAFTYADWSHYSTLLRDADTSIRVRDLLRAEISLTNIRAAGIAPTFRALVDDLKLNPRDFRHYALCNLSTLRQLYGAGWRELLREFSIGPYTYLVELDLPLQDVGSFDLDLDTMLKWPRRARHYCRDAGLAVPSGRALEPLSYEMLCERRTRDALDDWRYFMSLQREHLQVLGVGPAEARKLWHVSEALFRQTMDLGSATTDAGTVTATGSPAPGATATRPPPGFLQDW